MGDLEVKVKARQKRKTDRMGSAVEFFTQEHKAGSKDKTISARVNGKTYNQFKQICHRKGITPNACLNMLLSEYVFENKAYLDD